METRRIDLFGPLGPLLLFGVSVMAGLSLFRVAHAGAFMGRVAGVEGLWTCFAVGVRMDSIVACYLLAPPTILVLIGGRLAVRPAVHWCAAWAALVVYLEIATFPFMAQYDSRPNRLFFEYLVHPREVLGTLLAEYKLPLLLSVILAVVAWRAAARIVSLRLETAPRWSVGRRLVVLPVALALLFLGARSSLRHRGANISTAAFSSDHLLNELALNSIYSLGYAIYSLRHEMDPSVVYGSLPREEILARVRRWMGHPTEAFSDPEIPLLHLQIARVRRSRPLNLVIFLQESMGAGYVGCLGGMPLTPELCALADEGTLFTEMYATGTRTVRGIEAVVSGFLPTPGRSVVKLSNAQSGFFTLGEALGRQGYRCEFLYGGESHFDNMRSFFLGNGFDQAWDETTFRSPGFHGTWGVSDEDLVREANRAFVAMGDRPFLGVMLSTSNHSPFEFPDGRIELFEEPKNTVHNAIKYADYAIGEFFRLARREAYFADTLFLVIADHDTRVYGDDLLPVSKFRVPAVLLGPGVPVGRIERLASQIDVIPTLLGLLGLDLAHPVPGIDLLDPAISSPGRAVLQFDDLHGFLSGGNLVVHQPKAAPRSFRREAGRLVPVPGDPELERDALAHALIPGLLYRERRHRLP